MKLTDILPSLLPPGRTSRSGSCCRAMLLCLATLCATPQAHAGVVEIPDPGLEAALRRTLGIPDAPLQDTDLAGLTFLSAGNASIVGLAGLEYCTNLTKLYLFENRIADLTSLVGLTNLTILHLDDNQITDVTPLAGLTSLTVLTLDRNQITDVTPLAGLTSLIGLFLSENKIIDVSLLAGPTSLTDLWLDENQITDVTPLAGLTSLTSLYLSDNKMTDVSPLAGLTSLTDLRLDDNRLADVTPLAGLTNLSDLHLYDNQISDLTPLAGLTRLRGLYLDGNQITDVTPLAGLTRLTILWLTDNQITDVTPLAGLTKLRELYLHYNSICDLSPLNNNTGLAFGDQVVVKDNPLSVDACVIHVPLLELKGVSVDSGVACDGGGLADCPSTREGEIGADVHSADLDVNLVIALSEVLRIVQFYTSRGLHCADDVTDTEDGFVPGPGPNDSCVPHDTDYNPQDWAINVGEVLRVIQFYNSSGYRYCPLDGTEDGFCPEV